MSARRKLSVVAVALFSAATLAWTSLGTLSVANAQKDGVIARAHSGDRAPSFDKPIYILFLGSDARHDNPEHELMDSIHVVAIDPTTHKASIVGIPRDSWVSIDGGGKSKINSAGVGGPDRMVRTVERNWGCRFDYYMLIAFQGFTRLVNEIGGITVDVEQRLFEPDHGSHTDLRPGVQTLNGPQALGYARNRHDRPAGDLGRSLAQGKLIVGALAGARKQIAKDVRVPMRSLAALRRHVKMKIPLTDALNLGLMAMKINPKNVYNTVADGNPGSEGGASVVHLTAEGNRTLFDVCSGSKIGV